jgi:hypothetical protein
METVIELYTINFSRMYEVCNIGQQFVFVIAA